MRLSAGSIFDIVYRLNPEICASVGSMARRPAVVPVKAGCYAKYDRVEFRVFVFDPPSGMRWSCGGSLPSPARWTWGRSLGFALGSGTMLRASAAPRESKPPDGNLRWAWGPSIAFKIERQPRVSARLRKVVPWIRAGGSLGPADGVSATPLDSISRWTWGPSFIFHWPPHGNPVPLPPAGVCR